MLPSYNIPILLTLLSHCRPHMENVQIIQIRNAQNQLACHTRTKPQWSSKVIINCEKKLAKDIVYEHSGDMEKKTNEKIPETMISQEQCLQNSFLKRSQSVFTTDKGKVEVGLGIGFPSFFVCSNYM